MSRLEARKGFITRREMLAASSALLLSACSRPQEEQRAANLSGAREDRLERPNIVVYLADTLRADGLGCYGNPLPTSPRIDALANRGFLFEHCYSQASWTKPSIASLFSGVLPPVHQAAITHWDLAHLYDFPLQALRDRFTTLAESLNATGYHTAWFLASPMIQKGFGFDRGFDHYHFIVNQAANAQVDTVVRWLEHNAREPFFLFVHQVDPHGPYTPSEEVYGALFGRSLDEDRQRLPAEDKDLLKRFRFFYQKETEDKNTKKPPLQELSGGGKDYLKRLYAAEIRWVDGQVGRLLDYIDTSAYNGNTVVALISDHGEGFNEHGSFFHGDSLFNEEIHVPLIIRLPQQREGRRIARSVSQFDLYPTLVTLAGGKLPSYLQAQTLLDPRGNLAVEANRSVFSYLDHYDPDIQNWDASMIVGSRKVMSSKSGSKESFFDLVEDPGETRDLLHGEGLRGARNFEKDLDHFRGEVRRHRALSEYFGEAEWVSGGSQLKEELKSLGYS